jgi:biopolymer transport protein TolR
MAFTSSNGRTQTALADINITPLVDVVLVLLIIFMVTAPVLQSGIEVNVPHTRTVKEITEERLVISIDKSQKVFLGNDPININQIGARLKQRIRDPRHQSIYLRSDEDVPFGAFATVMDAIKQAGHQQREHRYAADGYPWQSPSLILTCTISTSIPNPRNCAGLWPGRSACIWHSRRSSRSTRCSFTAFAVEGWGSGGGGDAMGATLVSSVPLPANPAETTNVLATESKGLSKSQPMVQEKEPEAIPIPDKNTKVKPKPATSVKTNAAKPEPEPPESNQIPYGEGGPVSGPYTMSAGGAKGGFGFTGGGGDFGSRVLMVRASGAAQGHRKIG